MVGHPPWVDERQSIKGCISAVVCGTSLIHANSLCMQVATDAMVKQPQPGDPSYELFDKVKHVTVVIPRRLPTLVLLLMWVELVRLSGWSLSGWSLSGWSLSGWSW